jgi:Lipase (class 3)
MPASANPALSMATLCNISYNDASEIANDVTDFNAGLTVVWGPVEYTPPDAFESVSLIYIVKGPVVTNDETEYTVVIRGTNFESWTSWTQEDFDIGTSVPFNSLVAAAPADAVISGGTNNGMGYLIENSYDNNGVSPSGYLQSVGINYITQLNVTGHSLGGTLTPVYFTYLCYQLYGGSPIGNTDVNCYLFSFAGLTPGNDSFNSYFQSYIPNGLNWRYVNPLDIAPNCWWSLANIQNIYVNPPGFDLGIGFAENDFLSDLFDEIPAAPNNYAQPDGGEVLLPVNFNFDFPDDDFWTFQASYQHHSSTYMSLVAML